MRIPFVLAAGILSLTTVGQVVQVVPRQARVDLLNEPFSADAVTTLARTLADGTHITRQTMIVKMYRDSAGRSRSERNPGQFMAGQPAPPAIIMISDPIGGYSYVLDSGSKIARRTPLKPGPPDAPIIPPPPNLQAAPVANGLKPEFKTEDLGTQTMEGLVVEGRRTTVTYPVGSMGNDREITNVSEIWSNKELRLMILQIHSDPRNGETTTKIEHLSRTQPDPNLFLPPPDYKVVDAPAVQSRVQ